LAILSNEVIAGFGEVSASNAQNGMVRSGFPFLRMAHGAMRAEAEQFYATAPRNCRSRLSGLPMNLPGRIRSPAPSKNHLDHDMRQRIISRRRHVAPALLLC
jgi:hypothetical protein